MRISVWSSYVCSSDLSSPRHGSRAISARRVARREIPTAPSTAFHARRSRGDRKSVVKGMSVSVRVDLGGRRIINKKKKKKYNNIYSEQSDLSEIYSNHTMSEYYLCQFLL